MLGSQRSVPFVVELAVGNTEIFYKFPDRRTRPFDDRVNPGKLRVTLVDIADS